MQITTVWLMADQGNLENVVSSISENVDTLKEWPHIFLEGLGQLELMELWKIINPKALETQVSDGLLLDHQKLYLTTLNRDFIHAIGWIEDSAIENVAQEWARKIAPLHIKENLDLLTKLMMLIGIVKQALDQQKIILQAITT
ncbi:MAG: hypothetical protein ABL958_07115 [Bdellovibrionia bacterium]